jgi:hypothetical protein
MKVTSRYLHDAFHEEAPTMVTTDCNRSRFVPERLSNGHYGVYDTQLEGYVLRDVAGGLANRVAACLNAPDRRETSEPQLVAAATPVH